MIIVSRGNLAVACYDDVSPEEALRAYAEENLPRVCRFNPLIEVDGALVLECLSEKYDAVVYLENF